MRGNRCGTLGASRTSLAAGRDGDRGAALAVTLVLSLVLAVLVGALFVLFTSNRKSYLFTRDRIRAQLAAESGVSLALHALALEEGAPAGDEPFSLPGDSAQWIELPGSGDRVWVVIDPFHGNGAPYTIGGVEIRCRGVSGGRTRDVSVTAVPDYPSRYALLVDAGIKGSFLCDGRVIDGPVHGNDLVEFSSHTPDSAGDVYVEYVSTGNPEGFRFADAGMSDEPHPENSSVWVRPYMHHRQGLPYWNPSGLSFDFGELAAWFRSINTGSAPGIVSLGRAQRVVVDGDFLYSKADYATPPDTVDLSEHDVVLVSNGASPLYVKTTGIVRWPLTLIATGSIYIAGDLEGSYVRDGGPLALVTMGDFVVAEPSWASGSWDWPRPWNIDTERSLLLRAVLVAPTGTIRAQDPSIPEGRERVSLTGSLVLYSMNGTMGYTDNGYELTVSWDAGLSVSHPPLFRSLDRWSVISWTLDPDYDGLEIDDDLF